MRTLEDVKVGDVVIVHGRWSKKLAMVQSITPSGLIKVNNLLYYPDGRQRGGSTWELTHISKATEEQIKEIKEESCIAQTLKRMHNTSKIDYAQALAINSILDGMDITMNSNTIEIAKYEV